MIHHTVPRDKPSRRCDDCTWYAYDGTNKCDSAYVTDIMFHDAYYNADKCDMYKERDAFEDYLIDLIRKFDKKEMDEFETGDPLNINRYKATRGAVENILWTYQEMRDAELIP